MLTAAISRSRHDNMRRRLMAAACMLLFFSCLAVLTAYNAHQLFSQQMLFSWSMILCFGAVVTDPIVRVWWLLLEGFAVIAVIWMTFGREYIKYKSKLHHVCLDIYTPEADGQGQYGTARWMTGKEVERVFTTVHIDHGGPVIRDLIEHGYDDLEEGDIGGTV